MKRAVVLAGLVVAGGVLATWSSVVSGQGGAPAPMVVEVEKIRDNLFILKGGGGNTAALIGAAGVTLVDTKLPGWGKPLIEKVKELTNKPVTTIVNTHTHFDHVSGNVEFPATVEVITHENTARLMKEANPVTGLQTGPQPNLFTQNGGRGLAKKTFKDKMTVGSGKEKIELRYFGRAHTSGDAFVIFPELRVLHTGDTFPNKGMPIMDANNGGSGVAYADTVAKAATLKGIDTVVTGHAATTMTMADVKEYSEFVRDFVQTVQAGKKAGKSVDEITNGWKVPDRFKGYAQPMPNRVKPNVEVIFNETK